MTAAECGASNEYHNMTKKYEYRMREEIWLFILKREK